MWYSFFKQEKEHRLDNNINVVTSEATRVSERLMNIMKAGINRLMDHNANHIILLYYHLLVSCRSLVDQCGFLGSCKPKI